MPSTKLKNVQNVFFEITKTTTIMKKIFCVALLALSFCATVSAQHNLRTGYFLDGYIYKHKLNPAFASDRSYFAIPVAGYVTAGVESTLPASTFLNAGPDGKYATFLNPNVNTDFLSSISADTKYPMNLNVDVPVISFGFHAGKTFNTLDLSLKSDIRSTVPGSLFYWAKEQYDSSMDMSGLDINSNTRLELAYGFSRQCGKKFRFGFKVKFLAGLVKADYAMEQLAMNVDNDVWSIASKGSGYYASSGVGLKIGEAGTVKGFDAPKKADAIFNSIKQTRNFGGAVDLGISWDILSWITFSASVTDLGVLNWKNVSKLESVETTGYTGFNAADAGSELKSLGAGLLDVMSAKVVGTEDAILDKLSATAHAGLEIRLPFYKRLSVGALATHRFDKVYGWQEVRGSVNWALFRWLSFSASHAWSFYGDTKLQSFGGAINFHPKGINIFVGVDSYKSVMNSLQLPELKFLPGENHLNTTVAVGVNFAFGKYHGRFPKKTAQPQTEN